MVVLPTLFKNCSHMFFFALIRHLSVSDSLSTSLLFLHFSFQQRFFYNKQLY